MTLGVLFYTLEATLKANGGVPCVGQAGGHLGQAAEKLKAPHTIRELDSGVGGP